MPVERMDQTNYFGAAIFWLYILAALVLTCLVLDSVLTTRPVNGKPNIKQPGNSKDVWLFGALAGLSFTALSFNMLHVLIQSYQLWSASHGLHPSISPAQIWHWSVTSTLFQDFGEAIVEDGIRYFWAQTALLGTLSVCFFMGFEGEYSMPFVRSPLHFLTRLSQGTHARYLVSGHSSV